MCSKFDERSYPATLFACAAKEGEGTITSEMQIPPLNMVQKLHKYLQGENSEGVLINMTVPVFFFNHLNTENNPDKSAICLWMDQDNKVEKAKGLTWI